MATAVVRALLWLSRKHGSFEALHDRLGGLCLLNWNSL